MIFLKGVDLLTRRARLRIVLVGSLIIGGAAGLLLAPRPLPEILECGSEVVVGAVRELVGTVDRTPPGRFHWSIGAVAWMGGPEGSRDCGLMATLDDGRMVAVRYRLLRARDTYELEVIEILWTKSLMTSLQ